ncbi:MAG: hypothetical protein ACP5MZ_00355 [Candidatus Micrarchaeia archaeon]
MKVFKGINWIADSITVAPSESEAKWVTKDPERVWLASLLRKEYPLSTPILARGSADINLISNHVFVLATHPRPYEQWIYDSLKSDIAIVAKTSEKRAAKARLEKEKLLALRRKGKLDAELESIKAMLSEMHSEGLIDAALGRGSYFDKNGYPSNHDDIDIILLNSKPFTQPGEWKNLKDEVRRNISKAKGNFWANFVDFKEGIIKKANDSNAPMFSFILLYTNYKGLGLYYEKYVLRNSVGIGVEGMPAEKSEKLAFEMSKHLHVDDREKLVKEGKLSIFPKPPKDS